MSAWLSCCRTNSLPTRPAHHDEMADLQCVLLAVAAHADLNLFPRCRIEAGVLIARAAGAGLELGEGEIRDVPLAIAGKNIRNPK